MHLLGPSLKRDDLARIGVHLQFYRDMGVRFDPEMYLKWIGQTFDLDPALLHGIGQHQVVSQLVREWGFLIWMEPLGMVTEDDIHGWEQHTQDDIDQGKKPISFVEYCQNIQKIPQADCVHNLQKAYEALPERWDPLFGSEVRLGDFIIGKRFKTTPTSTLYDARHLHDGGEYICKVANQRGNPLEDQLTTSIHARIQHPSVMAMAHHGRFQGRSCLIMPRMGNSLEIYTRGDRLSTDTVLRLGRMAMEGLAAIHGEGICHLDIKPGNLLWDGKRRLRIIDFENASFEGVPRASSTRYTQRYVAPERLSGQVPHRSADIFSMGLTLADLLTGNIVQECRHKFGEINEKTLDKDVRVALSILPDCPRKLSTTLRAMLKLAPEKRPTADQVLEVLWPEGNTIRRSPKTSVASLHPPVPPQEERSRELPPPFMLPWVRRLATIRRREVIQKYSELLNLHEELVILWALVACHHLDEDCEGLSREQLLEKAAKILEEKSSILVALDIPAAEIHRHFLRQMNLPFTARQLRRLIDEPADRESLPLMCSQMREAARSLGPLTQFKLCLRSARGSFFEVEPDGSFSTRLGIKNANRPGLWLVDKGVCILLSPWLQLDKGGLRIAKTSLEGEVVSRGV